MSYKTFKRRQQRKKQVFIRRDKWIRAIRQEAFEAWKKTYYEDFIKELRNEVWT